MKNDAQLHENGIEKHQADRLMGKRKFDRQYAVKVNAIPNDPTAKQK
jgi:hypothetical protein